MMKQKSENVIILDIGESKIRSLLASVNQDYTSNKDIFFETQGTSTTCNGLGKNGITNKELFSKSIKKSIDDLSDFTSYDITNVNVIYSHPSLEFFKETKTRTLRKDQIIRLSEGRLKEDQKKLINKIEKQNLHKKIVYFEFTSIVADGIEIVNDYEDFVANKSVVYSYNYILCPDVFLESLHHIIEKNVTIKRINPTIFPIRWMLTSSQKSQGIIVFDIDKHHSSLSIFKDDFLDHFEIIDFGDTYITEQIGLLKKVSMKDAEKIKRSLHTESPLLNKRETQMLYKKINKKIKDALLPILKNKEESYPNGIMLTGDISTFSDFIDNIQKITKIYTFSNNVEYTINTPDIESNSLWEHSYDYAKYITQNKTGSFETENDREPLFKNFFKKIHDSIIKVF